MYVIMMHTESLACGSSGASLVSSHDTESLASANAPVGTIYSSGMALELLKQVMAGHTAAQLPSRCAARDLLCFAEACTANASAQSSS